VSFRVCFVLGSLAVLLAAPVVQAQDAAHASAAARALFQEGVTCSDGGDWACAAERFGQAYRLRASPVIGSNYAIALMHLERWVEATEAFRAVQRDPSTAAVLRGDAERFIAEIEPRLGRITLRLVGPADEVVVVVDGHDDTSFVGAPVPIDPGDHVVEARRDGEVIAHATTHVDSGARVVVELTIPERPSEAAETPSVAPVLIAETPSVPPLPSDGGEPVHHTEIYEEWWFWTIIGVGVAAGVGVTAGVVASTGTVPPMGTLGTIDVRP
jgi:hypothetical protein